MKRLMILAAVFVACGVGIALAIWSATGRAARSPAARPAPDAVYHARGRVVMLPDAARPMNELQIHHEPIDVFVNPNGTTGMPSMIMPFPTETDSTVEGLAVGDAIEFDFAVWTTPGSRGFEARKIRKLPPGTKLNLPE